MIIQTPIKPLTLTEFLQKSYIEESPAYEYIAEKGLVRTNKFWGEGRGKREKGKGKRKTS